MTLFKKLLEAHVIFGGHQKILVVTITTSLLSSPLFSLPDFDFSVPGSMKLHNLISKLKKWIKILEAKTKQLPKFFLIEEKCRFLSNFSAQTAEVEIPGEFLMPKPTHYYIKIAR